MDAKQGPGISVQANEGEGNKTAAREFNDAQQAFVKSGQVDEKARDAERALDGPESRELEEAKAIGKSHIAGKDPREALRHPGNPLSASDSGKVRVRAYEIWEREGCPDGKDQDHWFEAESQLVSSQG
jgi:hypothetical protein